MEHGADNSPALWDRDGRAELNHLPEKARNLASETGTSDVDSYLIDMVRSTIPMPVLLSGELCQMFNNRASHQMPRNEERWSWPRSLSWSLRL